MQHLTEKERERNKTRSLRDVRREKQPNHISNLYLLLLPPNYRAACGQVAEDRAGKATPAALVSCLLSRNSISLADIIKTVD